MSVRVRIRQTEVGLRTRTFFGLCASLALAACAPSERDPQAVFQKELSIDGNTPARVEVRLDAATYLVEVREVDIDLRLDATPGSRAPVEDRIPRHGILYQLVDLKTPGPLRIELRSADHRTKKGTAVVVVARFKRSGTAPAGEPELGYAALATAGELTAEKTPAAAQKAADKLYEAITHFDSAHDEAHVAQAQYTLGNLLALARDDYPGAIRATDAAATIFEDLGDELGVMNSSTLRAAAQLELANGMDASKQLAEQTAMFNDAERRLQKAEQFFEKRGLPVRQEYAVNTRGARALYVGDYATAGAQFQRAVELARSNQDDREVATALANLAWVHNRSGYIAQAAQEYQALLTMLDPENQPYQYAVVLGNYGFCLMALGDFDKALTLHTEALAVYTRQGKETERANELAALGGLHFRIGDAQRALGIMRAAIAAQEKVGDVAGQASSLRVAGNAASAIGQHEQSLAYLRKSAQIDANPQSVARTRVLIAGELRALGDLRGSEQELVRTLESSNSLVRANALEERARLRSAQRNSAAAIADLRAADAEYVKMGLEFNRIETNSALSRALLAGGDVAGASAAADEALAITSRIRVKSANPEWRAHFLSARYAPYEARIAADLAGGAGDSAWRAFRISEEVRARSLADQLAVARKSAPTAAADDDLRARLTSLQIRLESRTQRQGADDPGTIELRRAVEEARAKVDATRSAVAARESDLPELQTEVQKSLPPSTAVLAYFVGDHESHAWLLTRDHLRHATLPGLEKLRNEVSEAVGGQSGHSPPRESMQSLSRTLTADLLEGISASRLLVIPDGPLDGVPFAALPVGTSPDDLFVDRFVLGYAPSLSLALKGQKRSLPQHRRVAVISDPVYAPDDRRLQLAMGASGGTLRGPREVSANNLTRLPYSALEARAVLRALGSDDAIVLDGFAATPSGVLSLPARDLGVLHFATHALARSDSPEQSALYLSEYSEDGGFVPNSRITVGDIAQSGLRADVVVLSGCSTGDGSELRGEGVLGLTYGFLANGSHAVVASLWPIEDASTARFMSEFYGAYRRNPEPAEALRQAQIRTRSLAKASVWSSFVVRANGFP